MKTYLESLVEQIQKHDIVDDNASIDIRAIEGQPAIVQVQNGPLLVILMQNEELTELEEVKRIVL